MIWIETMYIAGPENRAQLWSVGFDDPRIPQIALRASPFNSGNRLAGAVRARRA